MSWSINVKAKGLQAALAAINSPPEEGKPSPRDIAIAANPGCEEQLDWVVGTAISLIESGNMGDPEECSWRISIAGHFNPHHQRLPTSVGDWANVNVYQEADGAS